jgi:hypothetical protein
MKPPNTGGFGGAGKGVGGGAPGLTGTHTFNCDSKYEVVDGRRLTPRP